MLVETSHPGNIGAAARAMKTMGLKDLALVRPRRFPDDEASARASGADDLLAAARVTDTVIGAIADCGLVVGATARLRGSRWPVTDPRSAAATIWRESSRTQVALLLGPEQSGLSNDDLAHCRLLVHIPTEADYGSLNLAMAVQVLCYELRMARQSLSAEPLEKRDAPPATAVELDGFHRHLERVLSEAGFLHPDHQKQMKLKLRRLFQRAELDRNEINILRGVLAALDPAGGRGQRDSV